MVVENASTPKNGRPRAVTLDAVLDAATELADDRGLDGVTFRALADRLDVSPMAIHRTTGGIDALQHALVSRIVGEVTRSVEWPDDWRGIVRLFADTLHDLLMRHPVILEAHRRASLVGPGADDVAYRVVAALRSAGLDEEAAAYAYGTLHDFVTGHVAIRLGRGDLELIQLPPERRAASVFTDHHDYDRRFSYGLDFVIGGIAAAAATPVPHEEQ
ncbi:MULTISPECIES: TetR/AcrR family transcriptional regulator [unclassified Streptomyces]|uniref:TetR/AcrR family transcriptional regulator n=1 Tax=unclassified Streptomyces TaxID=2593676 RepID=UPI00225AEDC1|nr:TetR/AcrR family transcriptional regulator [Streptomyces sp. NBC_01767]MCX4392574.1 TetR/AcrR family transcriptional regulator [Streptomyces sp. NBC_01767]